MFLLSSAKLPSCLTKVDAACGDVKSGCVVLVGTFLYEVQPARWLLAVRGQREQHSDETRLGTQHPSVAAVASCNFRRAERHGWFDTGNTACVV